MEGARDGQMLVQTGNFARKLAPRRNYRFLCAALSTPRNDTRTEWAAHQQICSNCSDIRKDANLQCAMICRIN
eukprot:scaffold56209_cov65-Cyclotella_meneghiniana.AAC.9